MTRITTRRRRPSGNNLGAFSICLYGNDVLHMGSRTYVTRPSEPGAVVAGVRKAALISISRQDSRYSWIRIA